MRIGWAGKALVVVWLGILGLAGTLAALDPKLHVVDFSRVDSPLFEIAEEGNYVFRDPGELPEAPEDCLAVATGDEPCDIGGVDWDTQSVIVVSFGVKPESFGIRITRILEAQDNYIVQVQKLIHCCPDEEGPIVLAVVVDKLDDRPVEFQVTSTSQCFD